MEDFYDDPELGRLEIKRGTSQTTYVDVCEKKLAKGKVVYYAKTRLDLNEGAQSKVGGTYENARECAINLAKYLKQHPPKPVAPCGRHLGDLHLAFDTCRMLSFGSARLMAARRIDCAVAGAASVASMQGSEACAVMMWVRTSTS